MDIGKYRMNLLIQQPNKQLKTTVATRFKATIWRKIL